MPQLIEFATNHYLLVAAAAAMLVTVLAYELRARGSTSGAIGPGEAVRLINAGAVVVDVRGREHFEAGHIAGAKHVPSAAIADGAKNLERFREKPLIAYCDTGVTAAAVVRELGRQGFRQARNLRGGLAAWRQDNLPLARE